MYHEANFYILFMNCMVVALYAARLSTKALNKRRKGFTVITLNGHFPNILFTETDKSRKIFLKNQLLKGQFPIQFFIFFTILFDLSQLSFNFSQFSFIFHDFKNFFQDLFPFFMILSLLPFFMTFPQFFIG